MAIIISEVSNTFEVVEPGIYRAVCCDIVDLGMQETPYGNKEQIRIHWMLDSYIKNGAYAGRPFTAVRRYTKSLNDKSALRRDLNKWRGRPFTQEELAGFNMDNIIGACCQLNIMAGDKDPDQQRFVESVLPDTKGAEPLVIPADFVRAADRKEGFDSYGNAKNSSNAVKFPAPDTSGPSDDVPF